MIHADSIASQPVWDVKEALRNEYVKAGKAILSQIRSSYADNTRDIPPKHKDGLLQNMGELPPKRFPAHRNPEITIPELLKSKIVAKNADGGLNIAIKLIRQKVTNSIDTLRNAFPRSANIDQAINKLDRELNILKRNPPSTVSQLTGIEGRVGYTYFNSWRTCQIKWKGTDKHPIPEDWLKIERRSSKLGSTSHPN